MKRLLTAALVLSLSLSLFAGCGSKDTGTSGSTDTGSGTEQPAGGSGLAIGIVLPTKEEPRWVQDEARFKAALEGTGYSAEILFSQGDSAREKQNVETLIAKGIKVLIITPHDGGAAAAAVEAAKEEGITVISYDRLVTNTDAVDYYITFNSVSVGEAQGQYLVDQLESGSTGNNLYLYAGAATDNNAFLFFEGAWNVLQPKIADGTFVVKNSTKAVELKDKATLTREEMGQIIEQVTTDWKPEVAKSKSESHITAAPPQGKTYILAPNDGTSRAIYDQFAKESGIEIFITGQDAEVPSIQYVIDGKQSMTVLKDVRDLVLGAIQTATDVLEGKEVETNGLYDNGKVEVKAKDIKVITVTQDNVQDTIIGSGYYEASEFTGL
ncbi:sugar ABC transporter substrate-binding protein [Anaerotalea alkaliphila]|uniref:Sugar ABC transporter substrate-binding protein n=1 Tax=Anaerotalea alkaliphila TaxID=2662126 RepID=A0A7X5HUZ2_9FIRM|nr:sugar-binding protein [Anaerotalea alkaliphila]NDL67148.1 sugar ABC transporter substrate-binding protein [Anaerotalea alkaliphila]